MSSIAFVSALAPIVCRCSWGKKSAHLGFSGGEIVSQELFKDKKAPSLSQERSEYMLVSRAWKCLFSNQGSYLSLKAVSSGTMLRHVGLCRMKSL